MFGGSDMLKFLISFFFILPIVTFIHLCGHIFFVSIFGGNERKIIIGCGKKLFSLKKIEVRKYYFWNGSCEFKSLKYDNRFTNTLIYIGGSLFNVIGIIVIYSLILSNMIEGSIFWYQFIYFSFYMMFFSLFPMDSSDGVPSDGKAAVLFLKNEHNDKFTGDIHIRKDED